MIYEPGETSTANHLSKCPGNKNLSMEAIKTELFVENLIANTLPDTVTTADIHHGSRHNETTLTLKGANGKGYILQHYTKQLVNYKHIFQELSVKEDATMMG